MNAAVTADSLYTASWRPSFGATEGEPVGHVVVRRLDDDVDAALLPVCAGEDAADLLSRVETSLRGPATEFEDAWGIGDSTKADPGSEQGWIPEKYRLREVMQDKNRDPAPGESVTAPDDRVMVGPDAAAVFAADQRWLADVLRPIFTVAVGDGVFPLLCPVSPEDGVLGESPLSVHDGVRRSELDLVPPAAGWPPDVPRRPRVLRRRERGGPGVPQARHPH